MTTSRTGTSRRWGPSRRARNTTRSSRRRTNRSSRSSGASAAWIRGGRKARRIRRRRSGALARRAAARRRRARRLAEHRRAGGPLRGGGRGREHLAREPGEGAAQYEQAAFKLDEFRRAIDPLPDADKLGFIDAIEGGRSQPSPEFQAAADAIRGTARRHARPDPRARHRQARSLHRPTTSRTSGRIRSARRGVPHRGARGRSRARRRSSRSARSRRRSRACGSGSSRCRLNPVDLTMLKLREMQKYLTAHRALNEMNEAELVKFVRAGDSARRATRASTTRSRRSSGRGGHGQLPEGARR
jgi:hypothetical protein